MSLDVDLIVDETFTCECGKTSKTGSYSAYDANITHNLGEMATKAGIYEALWRPYRLKENFNISKDNHEAEWKFEEENITLAKDIIPLLETGLSKLKKRRKYFEKFNSPNGWGIYEHFVPFVEKYLKACKEFPNSIIKVSR